MPDSDEPVAPRARVEITYRVDAPIELPLRILVLGDFTGRPDSTPVRARALSSVDPDRFDSVMAEHGLELRCRVPDLLSGGEPLDVDLRLRSLRDFTPEGLVTQVRALRDLKELRYAVAALRGPLGALPRFRRRLQSALADPELRAQLEAEVTDPRASERQAARVEARERLAREARTTTRPDRIARLSAMHLWLVEHALGTNPAIDIETARLLAHRPSDGVLHNEGVLARVEREPLVLAGWPNLHAEALLAHVEWSDATVAYAIGSSRASVVRMLLSVCVPCDRVVRRPVDRRETFLPRELEDMARCQRSSATLDLALRARRADEDVANALRELSHEQPWLALAIVRRPECPPDVLVRLAAYAMFTEEALRHPSVPRSVLSFVAERHASAWVRRAAHCALDACAGNDGAPEPAFRGWPLAVAHFLVSSIPSNTRDRVAWGRDPEGPLLSALGGSGPWWARLFAARAVARRFGRPRAPDALIRQPPAEQVDDPSTTAGQLELLLAQSHEPRRFPAPLPGDAALRFWIACHPHAAAHTLARLAGDADEYVARAALARIG